MSAPLVIVQLSMSNDRRIPAKVPYREAETVRESAERISFCATGAKSHQVLQPTAQCAVGMLADDLFDADYQIVSVWCQTRQHQRHKSVYHTLRYTFAKSSVATQTLDELREWYPTVEDDFINLINDAFWRARAYLNPGEDGKSLLSLNLEVPVPQFRSDGSEVLVWRKDAEGRRTGDSAVPIEPLATLRLNQDLTISVK